MYRIKSIKINGFWGRGEVECNFNEDVNIIIGRNGTGKTTLMNILHSVLTCDLNGLAESGFESVEVFLKSSENEKTVSVYRLDGGEDRERGIEEVLYTIDEHEYRVPLLAALAHRQSPMLRRRVEADVLEVRNALSSLLRISSISVYRLRHDEDLEVRDRYGTRITAPVDYRLDGVLNDLAQYCAELGMKEQDVSRQLQKDVLISILYNASEQHTQLSISDYDRENEETELKKAYAQLKVIDKDVAHKIKLHTKAIEQVIEDIRSKKDKIDIKPLEAYGKTKKVIELSLEANKKTKLINSQLELFLEKLKSFMPEKDFVIESGRLVVKNTFGDIKISRLSSGEKQLIILLIEALLQREQDYLLLADEPEISLHIEWQGKIIPAVRELNPQAQVIVATHSPEVAAPYRDKIFNMSEIYSE